VYFRVTRSSQTCPRRDGEQRGDARRRERSLLRRGVAILPEARRRDALTDAIDAMIAEDFADPVPAVDGAAAIAIAAVFVERREIGQPISFRVCQIAATTRRLGARRWRRTTCGTSTATESMS